MYLCFFFKQKTAYEMRISGWSSDVCSSDLPAVAKDTVGSVLSRLKSEGALVYVGARYYEKRFAPQNRPFDPGLRAVNCERKTPGDQSPGVLFCRSRSSTGKSRRLLTARLLVRVPPGAHKRNDRTLGGTSLPLPRPQYT